MNDKLVIGLVLVIVLTLGVVFPRGNSVVERIVDNTLGAVAGPTSTFDCEEHNGIRTCFTKRALTLATTTPCAIKSPNATSTLTHNSLRVSVATSTAVVWTVAKSATAFATTTRLNLVTLASGEQGTLVGTTTALGVNIVTDDIATFAPNTYVVWGGAGYVPAGSFLGGSCQAEFKVI